LFKFFEKIGRKNVKKIYWIGSIILGIIFVAFAILYAYKSWAWLLYGSMIIFLILPIITFVYILTVWSWRIEDLLNDYKKNDNVLSGGFAMLVFFALPVIFLLIFSQQEEYSEFKNFFEGLLTLIIAAMPALIGLLGVQYSVAVQERNRKKDIRLGAKPFFRINCCMIELLSDEKQENCHTMRIKIQLINISRNIGIPLKLSLCNSNDFEVLFPYNPLAHNDEFEKVVEIRSAEPFESTVNIILTYKDVYQNVYESKIFFVPHEKFDLSKTEVISDEYLQNIKEQ
jgi:hypothetical protein